MKEGDELASEAAEDCAGVGDPVRVEQVPVDRQEAVQLQQQQVQVVAHLHSKLQDSFKKDLMFSMDNFEVVP